MVTLNSAGNQLVKLNIKKTGMIVCGKAICLQLATGHITHTHTHRFTQTQPCLMEHDVCVCVCMCRNSAEAHHKNTKLINLKDINKTWGNW